MTPNPVRDRPAVPRSILISGGLASGGVQTHVSLLCKLLRREGAEVTLAAVANSWPRQLLRDLKADGVRILTTPFGFGRFSRLGKAQAILTWPILIRRRFDVLYCVGRGRFHNWMLRFLKDDGISIYHEIVDAQQGAVNTFAYSAEMDAVISNSQAVAEGLRPFFPNHPIKTIPFLTSSEPLAPPADRPPIREGTMRAVYLGRLVSHKGVDWLVREWKRIMDRPGVSPCRLDVYGGDFPNEPLAESLRANIRADGLGNCIEIRGEYQYADLPAILSAADLVLLPSRVEGLPLVLVEAMSRGVPFVATDAGGTRELSNPDVEVVPVDDREAFISAIGRMADRLRHDGIDPKRLYRWCESRYGYEIVSAAWLRALLTSREFFGQSPKTAASS